MKSIDAKYHVKVGYWKEPIPKLQEPFKGLEGTICRTTKSR
jgi:hypothetical protein